MLRRKDTYNVLIDKRAKNWFVICMHDLNPQLFVNMNLMHGWACWGVLEV